jgi:hypothetical protein
MVTNNFERKDDPFSRLQLPCFVHQRLENRLMSLSDRLVNVCRSFGACWMGVQAVGRRGMGPGTFLAIGLLQTLVQNGGFYTFHVERWVMSLLLLHFVSHS